MIVGCHYLKNEIENVVITSKNAVEALLTSFSPIELQFKNIYCVGRRTKKLIEKRIGKVKHSEKNAKKLAEYLVEFMEGTEVTYFCSDIHLRLRGTCDEFRLYTLYLPHSLGLVHVQL